MKRLLVLFEILFMMLAAKSQTVVFNDPKMELVEEVSNQKYTIAFTIKGLPTGLPLVVSFIDKGAGSALSGIDYELDRSASAVSCTNGSGSLSINVLPDKVLEQKDSIVLTATIWDATKTYEFGKTEAIFHIVDKADKDAKDIIEKAEADEHRKKHNFPDETNTPKLELLQFTDFIGFSNDKPNGILQQEFRYKLPINTYWRGSPEPSKWRHQFLRSVIIDLLLNRIDKSQKEVAYNYPANLKGAPDSGIQKFTTMDLWKYSNLHFGVRAVLLAFEHRNFRFHFQAGAKLVRNRPFIDSIYIPVADREKEFRPVYSVAYNIELYGKTLLDPKKFVNLEVNTGLTWLYLLDNYYKQFDAAMVDQYDRASALIPVKGQTSNTVHPFLSFSFRFSKNFGEEKENYTYFRFNYLHQTGLYSTYSKRLTNTGETIYTLNPTPSHFHNNFLQLQLGVSLGIDALFQKLPKKDDSGKNKNVSDTSG